MGTDTVVSIPDEINGLPVTTLETLSFLRLDYIDRYGEFETLVIFDEIIIPDTVTKIVYPFDGNVKSVTANCNSYAAEFIADCGFDNLTLNVIHNTSLDWVVVKEPTCTELGLKHRGCINCEKGDNVELPALGHNFSEGWTVDVEPTCTEGGIKSRKCSRCNESCDVTELTALGHDFSSEWTIDVQPTCYDGGLKSHHCSRCDEIESSTVIEPTEHMPGDEWHYSSGFSCVDYDGYRYKLCENCGAQCEFESINGHAFENNLCIYCGYTLFNYKVSNNEVTITGFNGRYVDYDSAEGYSYIQNAVIPEYIDGYPVTAIYDYALNECYIEATHFYQCLQQFSE